MSQTAVFKHETDPFTMNPTSLLELSPAAYYLYGYIKSKPSGWVFHKQNIIKEIKMGKHTFYRGLKELEDNGYLIREQINEKGKFGVVVYTLLSTGKKGKHRVPKNRIRKIGTHNNINIYLDEEKNEKEKKKSQGDNRKYPYGVTSLEATMNLNDIMEMSKAKTKEAKERKEKKQEQRASAFTDKKNNAVILEEYLYSLLSEKDAKHARNYKEPESIYKFANDCKNVGITELRDQKLVLKFFVENWESLCNTLSEIHYCSMERYPNLFNIVWCFYKVGLLTGGFGLHINRKLFKKGDN